MAKKHNSESFNIQKVLKEDGVYAYGFGHIAKVVMLDRDLSCAAKGIYAYFCSFTNAKNAAYPKLSTILKDLGINKRTYYKHFDLLTENGYITVQKAEGFKNKNIYIINEYVKKVNYEISDADCTESAFVVEGIKTYGYGTIPKLIMIDMRLSIKAKALMAFLLSLSGAGRCAFPRRDIICLQLGVSKNTYVGMMNELISYGYIKVKQRRTRNGTFAVNDYHFEINPIENTVKKEPETINVAKDDDVDKNVDLCESADETEDYPIENDLKSNDKNGLNSGSEPCTKKCTFPKNGLNSEFSPRPKNCTFPETYRVTKNTPFPCPQNCTNNNINSNNNNESLCTSILYPCNKVISDKIPKGNELRESLHCISKYKYYRQFSDAYARKHCRTVEIIISIFSEDYIIHKNNKIEAGDLWREFVHILDSNYQKDSPCVDFIYDILMYFDQCSSMYRIEHPTKYLRTLIIDKIINDYDSEILS